MVLPKGVARFTGIRNLATHKDKDSKIRAGQPAGQGLIQPKPQQALSPKFRDYGLGSVSNSYRSRFRIVSV